MIDYVIFLATPRFTGSLECDLKKNLATQRFTASLDFFIFFVLQTGLQLNFL